MASGATPSAFWIAGNDVATTWMSRMATNIPRHINTKPIQIASGLLPHRRARPLIRLPRCANQRAGLPVRRGCEETETIRLALVLPLGSEAVPTPEAARRPPPRRPRDSDAT